MDGCLIRALLFLLPSIAFADSVNGEWYSTTRALSMGNAGIASAEDSTTAMFYNPAALNRSKKAAVELFNPQYDVGTGVFQESGLSFAKHISLEKARPMLQNRPGRVSSMGTAIYPNVSAHNFNFGILGRAEGSSYVDGNKLYYKSRYHIIPSFGFSFGMLGSRLRLGVAVRAIQTTENDRNVLTSSTKSIGYSVDASEGFGIGLDAGALLTIPVAASPTIGIVARNVGDTSFNNGAPARITTGPEVTRREKIKMTYDAGFAFFPKLSKKSGFTFSVDYRDALKVHDVTTMRRVNVGFEFDLNRVAYLRAGLGRGYWTAGMGLASKLGSLDIGTYAEELDARSFRAKEDRRISIRYGSRF
jgi:hypothetical protein